MIQIDMEMPKNCLDCNFRYQSFCSIDGHHEPHLEKERCPLKVTPQEPRWIPVSERLPNWDINCLVIDEDGEYGVGYYREDVHAWDSPNWGWIERKDRVDNKEAFTEPCGIGKVIAWMPLPEGYKESEE